MAEWHHWLDGNESEWTLGICDGQGALVCCDSWRHKESDTTEWLNWTELNCLVVFPTVFNLSLNLAIRSSWLEPQSAHSLVFADCIELLHLWLQRILSIWFHCWPSSDVHVYSLLLCCGKSVVAMTCAFSWQNSISLCPALFCIPGPNFPVISSVSWLPTFALQSPIMKRTSFLGVTSKSSCRFS